MAKKTKKPEFPEETRICGLVFVCQLIAVLSAVSIVYLAVASYAPAIRALISNYNESTIMCNTLFADDSTEPSPNPTETNPNSAEQSPNSSWVSCYEWCLTKPSGLGIQIWVSARNNGTELTFEQCTDRTEKHCATDDVLPTYRHICHKEQCKNLTGSFNCSKGICINITSAYSCSKMQRDEHQVRCKSQENCKELEGFYTCAEGVCMRFLDPFSCERRCKDMVTQGKNVVIFTGDRITIANCHNALELHSQELIWDARSTNEMLFVSCHTLRNSSNNLQATDCINASLVNTEKFSELMNLSEILYAYNNPNITRRLPPSVSGIAVPVEAELMIHNRIKLSINLESCVNTLRDECRHFFSIYGRDGRDHRAPSRFPCYHSLDKNDTVLTSFSRDQTIVEFTLTAAVPGGLFVLSCSCLVLCTKLVIVGPDAHMKLAKFRKNKEGITEDNTAETELICNNESSKNSKNSRNSDVMNATKPLSI